MRYAKRTDANHALIRDGLRAMGHEVMDLSGAGDGIPDLCVQLVAGQPFFLEIKDGAKPKSAQKLTKAQELWHNHCWQVTAKVTNLDEAKAALAWAANRSKQ